jgi:hypothetical protein
VKVKGLIEALSRGLPGINQGNGQVEHDRLPVESFDESMA